MKNTQYSCKDHPKTTLTDLLLAIRSRDEDAVRENLGKLFPSNGWERAKWACQHGFANLVREAVDAEVRVDAVGTNGQSLLHWAAYGGASDAVEVLLAKGAAWDLQEYIESQTPLHWAAKTGAGDAMETLIRAGADVDSGDRLQRTPLHLACHFLEPSAVRYLCRSSADIERACFSNLRPLHYAALCTPDRNPRFDADRQSDTIRALVDAGCDLSAAGGPGAESALAMSVRQDFVNVARVLVQNGAQVEVAVIELAEKLCRSAELRNILRDAIQPVRV